ncbi:alkaline phosphatase D [Catalinimonas alkaloidigena]|uniref:Alkaline phosphatase D n=2 Tax=Catalinimonas alkaloidigena TaxID=1075417 RepID=A0A1G9N3F0_9BACT|nr:alkaline phosphatase D [Catalinimonas alkaloidigena]
MVGYSEMREVALWVQTTTAADVRFEYFDQAEPKTRYRTPTQRTEPQVAYAATLIADRVLPGKTYTYELFINNRKVTRPYPLTFQSQPLWQWRTDPPDFTFATGSCAYINEPAFDRPGTPYGSDYEIFQAMYETHPAFMLWLGDNTYLREPDWNTRTGVLHRYTHTRSLPEMQPFLGSVHQYAIWDDHDYGPNDADRSFAYKDLTSEVFRAFWPNPNYDVINEGGITGTFEWGDVQFFLLDDRYFRTPNDRYVGERHMLGKAQIDWLIDALVGSRAPFKFIAVGGQVLNPAPMFETMAIYPEEREELLRRLREVNVPGVIFLTGDRHHTEMSKLERPGTYPLYDLTTSSLTAGVAPPAKDENNYLRDPESLLVEHNFALLSVTGPRTDRMLTIRILDKEGKERWKKEIKASELRP